MDSFETINVNQNLHTFAFYNIENLFDVFNDAAVNDDEFLPNTKKNWTLKRYTNKLHKLSLSISKIGEKETGTYPAIVGLAEVENKKVLNDLIHHENLKQCHYQYIHYNSKDERGIDVAFLYNSKIFEVTHAQPYSYPLQNTDGTPDYTRDIVVVSGKFMGILVHFIVNHWPSRNDGLEASEYKRMAASKQVETIVAEIKKTDADAKIIIMGDFNDNSDNNSIKSLVAQCNLYNAMETLRSYSRGSVSFNKKWDLFDQILLTPNFFEHTTGQLEFEMANIFDEEFLKLHNGFFKGTPFRTYIGTKYQGGYSDHFPVYIVCKINT